MKHHAPIHAPNDGHERATRARILVADDHKALLSRVVALLSAEFLVVGVVSDGAQLVEAEAALKPDVLIVDICMPILGGLDAVARIRRHGSQVPVVCLTAHVGVDMIEAAWAAGATGYVCKASLARDLVPAIRAALAGERFLSARAAPKGPKPG